MEIRYRIIKAMASLLEANTLDSISVVEICDVAQVSRQAFYRRFKDKYDASTWYFDQIVDKTCRQVGRTMSWKAGYLAFFRAMETNKVFHGKLVESHDYNAMPSLSMRSVEKGLLETCEQCPKIELTPEVAFQIHAFARIDSENVSEWLRDGCTPSADVFVVWFLALVPRQLFDLLELDGTVPSADPAFFFVA